MKKTFKFLLPLLALMAFGTFFTSCDDMFTSPEYMIVRMDSSVPVGAKIDVQICSADFKNNVYTCGSVLVDAQNLANGAKVSIASKVTGGFWYGLRAKTPMENSYTEIPQGKNGDTCCCIAMNNKYSLIVHVSYNISTGYNIYYDWEIN